MMEAARTYETSVDIQLRTRQYITEDSELHTRRRENLKSHKIRNGITDDQAGGVGHFGRDVGLSEKCKSVPWMSHYDLAATHRYP
jgi:hypothetical protein